MNDQVDQAFENNSIDKFFEKSGSEEFEVSETIRHRARSAKNFALVSMILSGALFMLLIGSFSFALLIPSLGYFAILTLPISFFCSVLEGVLMIGAIILNIIALVNTGKQQKEFKLYNDGSEKDALQSTIRLGRIFTYIGMGVAALALLLIIPLNLLEFLLAII